MNRFRCGDVVPGCGAATSGTEDEILGRVGTRAASYHGDAEVGHELVDAVRSHTTPVA